MAGPELGAARRHTTHAYVRSERDERVLAQLLAVAIGVAVTLTWLGSIAPVQSVPAPPLSVFRVTTNE